MIFNYTPLEHFCGIYHEAAIKVYTQIFRVHTFFNGGGGGDPWTLDPTLSQTVVLD